MAYIGTRKINNSSRLVPMNLLPDSIHPLRQDWLDFPCDRALGESEYRATITKPTQAHQVWRVITCIAEYPSSISGGPVWVGYGNPGTGTRAPHSWPIAGQIIVKASSISPKPASIETTLDFVATPRRCFPLTPTHQKRTRPAGSQ